MRRMRARLRSPIVLLILPPLFWAGNAIVGKAIVGTVPPLALSFWRWMLAFLVLLSSALRGVANHWSDIKREWPLLTLLSVLGVGAYNSFQYLALQSTSAICSPCRLPSALCRYCPSICGNAHTLAISS